MLGVGLAPVEPMPGRWRYDAEIVPAHGHPIETASFGTPHLVIDPYDTVLPERGPVPAAIAMALSRPGRRLVPR